VKALHRAVLADQFPTDTYPGQIQTLVFGGGLNAGYAFAPGQNFIMAGCTNGKRAAAFCRSPFFVMALAPERPAVAIQAWYGYNFKP
jgi:hypothetical protein